MSRAKRCWTCGITKDQAAFHVDLSQYDELAAECSRCHGYREAARHADGEYGPREYRIEGEGRKRPLRPTAAGVYLQYMLALRPGHSPEDRERLSREAKRLAAGAVR